MKKYTAHYQDGSTRIVDEHEKAAIERAPFGHRVAFHPISEHDGSNIESISKTMQAGE